ncbi:T9SS type A sorting domain-containing protein [Aquimarina pacifica]|uniref:T9SS type A sorting domain-containing protein n=1 Tax=Aquimarina pacifica TaxID=1296415 RepID=UPI000471BD66|nr:T9SS type A sorting domain-containing protein [Aquimarina pacifica]
MKKIILVLFVGLLYFQTSHAQDQYYLEIAGGFVYTGTSAVGYEPGYGSYQAIVYDKDDVLLSSIGFSDRGTDEYSVDGGMAISAGVLLSKRPYTIRYKFDYCLIIDNDDSTTCDVSNTYSTVLDGTRDLFDHVYRSSTNGNFTHHVEAVLMPYLNERLLNANDTSKNICVDEPIFPIDSSNPTEDIPGLTWFYYDKAGYWENIYEFSDNYPLNASVFEVFESFGLHFNYTSRNMQLRMQYKPPGSNVRAAPPLYEGGVLDEGAYAIVERVVEECSPDFVDINAITPTCSNSGDGSFILELKGEIDNDQNLFVSVYWDENNDGNFVTDEFLVNNYDSTNNSYLYDDLDIDGEDITFKWKPRTGSYELGDGRYAVVYQLYPDGDTPDDPASIEESYSFTINAPDPVEFSAIGIHPKCFGDIPSIRVTPKGGSGSFEYKRNTNDWETLPNNGIIANLSASTHNIRIRDTDECVAMNGDNPKIVTITFDAKEEITFDGDMTPALGFGLNGEIELKDFDGGSGTYEDYEWFRLGQTTPINGENSSNFIGPAGKYIAVVIDSEGCRGEQEFEITQPPLLEVSISITRPITCYGDNDGALTATGAGGLLKNSENYTYEWHREGDAFPLGTGTISGTGTQTITTLPNIGDGIYYVIITDSNGITAQSEDFDFSEPDKVVFSAAPKDVSCHGGNDGTITLTVSGGSETYNYQIDDGTWTNFSNGDAITNLQKGTYTIRVKDTNNCTGYSDNEEELEVVVDQPVTPLTISLDNINFPSGFGLTNGNIDIIVSGGTPGYTYSWINEIGDEVGIDKNLINIGKGAYTVTVEDINECTISSETIEVTEPDPLVVTLSATMVQCFEAADGTITATPTGGVPNLDSTYNYQWQKEIAGLYTNIGQTSQTATNLDPGIYKVIVTDFKGNSTDNPPLINPPIVVPSVVITQPELLEISNSFIKNNICYGGDHGSIDIEVIGGTLPYHYAWYTSDDDLISEDQNILDLLADTYTITVTDANDCQITVPYTVLEPNPVTITYTAFGTPSTAGASDGWVEAQISDGSGMANLVYSYLWTDASGTSLNAQTTTSIIGLSNDIFQIRLEGISAGNYHLDIDGVTNPDTGQEYNCTLIESEFEMYDPIEATIAVHVPISCNQNNTFNNPFSDGQLIATVTGGLPFTTGQPYKYYWKKQDDSGTYIDLPAQTTAIAVDLSTGNYALNVEDALGRIIGIYDSAILIEATDELYTFEEPELLEVSMSSTAITCDSGNNGTASVNISGGISPYTILWSNGSSTATITDLIAGKYIAYIIDARGCEVTGQVSVDQPGGLEIKVIEQINPTCYLGNDGSISVTVEGGTPPYTYAWDTINSNSMLAQELPAGIHRFQVTDASGCMGFKDIELIDPEPTLVNLGNDRTLCNGQTHGLDITIDDDLATYSWTSDNGFTSNTPAITITEAGTYTATLTTRLGCIGTDTIRITTSAVDIDSQLVITSQAYAEEDVIVVNASDPLSINTEWMISGGEAEIIDESNEALVLRFNTPGAYEITLRSYQGDCYQDDMKPIIIDEPRTLIDDIETNSPYILEFDTFPNPNSGNFTISVSLAEESWISLRLFNLVSNTPLITQERSNSSNYTIDNSMNLPSGIYFLLLETEKESQIRKIVIN